MSDQPKDHLSNLPVEVLDNILLHVSSSSDLHAIANTSSILRQAVKARAAAICNSAILSRFPDMVKNLDLDVVGGWLVSVNPCIDAQILRAHVDKCQECKQKLSPMLLGLSSIYDLGFPKEIQLHDDVTLGIKLSIGGPHILVFLEEYGAQMRLQNHTFQGTGYLMFLLLSKLSGVASSDDADRIIKKICDGQAARFYEKYLRRLQGVNVHEHEDDDDEGHGDGYGSASATDLWKRINWFAGIGGIENGAGN